MGCCERPKGCGRRLGTPRPCTHLEDRTLIGLWPRAGLFEGIGAYSSSGSTRKPNCSISSRRCPSRASDVVGRPYACLARKRDAPPTPRSDSYLGVRPLGSKLPKVSISFAYPISRSSERTALRRVPKRPRRHPATKAMSRPPRNTRTVFPTSYAKSMPCGLPRRGSCVVRPTDGP